MTAPAPDLERHGRAGAAAVAGPAPAPPAPRSLRSWLALAGELAALGTVLVLHLGQGPAAVGLGDLLALATGGGSEETWRVLVGSRLPRALAGLVAGAALGMSGALAQSATRNPLAEPSTLGVSAGAYAAVVATAAAGLHVSTLPRGGVAFLGGLAAAAAVHLLAAGAPEQPGRVLLAGTAVTMSLTALATLLITLEEESTQGLFFWGNGSLVQVSLDRPLAMLPVAAAAGLGAMLLSRPLDLLGLGDEAASALGASAARTRLLALLLSVLLAAAAVTVTGPLGFVGLAAPAGLRLAGVRRHALLLPAAAIAGAVLLLAADLAARALLVNAVGGEIPVGIVTALAGAPVFVLLARRAATGSVDRGAAVLARRPRLPYPLVLAGAAGALAVTVALGLRLGDVPVGWGDLAAALRGAGDPLVERVLAHRAPRLLVAAAAGACLAVAGVAAQAVIRNPLAEPYVLGVTGGASLGAVLLVTVLPAAAAAPGALPAAALAGGLAALALVMALARQGQELDPARVVLVGVGLAAALLSLVAVLALRAQLSLAAALTWLAGSTYARGLDELAWLAAPLAAALLLWALARPLDLLALGGELPQSLGLRTGRARAAALGASALLAAGAAAAVGTIGFVGLLAPHLARPLVGVRHRRLVPAAALIGAVIVAAADVLGRWVLAPKEIPAGILTALIGTPYLAWLLRRDRIGRGAA